MSNKTIVKVYGPYLHKTSKRKIVTVYYLDGSHGTINYARYKFEQSIGRKLLPHEHVDHKDDNKQNDKIANLQILSKQRNSAKQYEDNPDRRTKYELYECPNCGELNLKPIWRYRRAMKLNQVGLFCDSFCSDNYKKQP